MQVVGQRDSHCGSLARRLFFFVASSRNVLGDLRHQTVDVRQQGEQLLSLLRRRARGALVEDTVPRNLVLRQRPLKYSLCNETDNSRVANRLDHTLCIAVD